MRVAVLGAGFQGTCAALELARRGVDVDLYDRNDACITQAGVRNEGKIHLGFVYAHDPGLTTARLMIRGALQFTAALRRWLDLDIERIGVSEGHDYVVHRDSMVSPDAVLAYFAKVAELVRASGGASYLGRDAQAIAVRQRANEPGGVYDPSTVAMAIETTERSVDVIRLATLMRERIANERRVTFRPNRHVAAVRRAGDLIEVSCEHAGQPERERYRHVVNCLWDGKLLIDQQMGFLPAHRWLHRLKFGIHARLRQPDASVPSATIVVGRFGDIVRLNDRHMYLSWYPVSLRGISSGLAPPEGPRELDGEDARHMLEASLTAIGRIVVPLRAFRPEMFEQVTVAGGIVLAAGETDINDPNSRLHSRSLVGVRTLDRYHSVDPGKYTLAPLFAIEVADRVCGER